MTGQNSYQDIVLVALGYKTYVVFKVLIAIVQF